MKKRVSFVSALLFVNFTVYAEFSSTIGYHVFVPNQSTWGVATQAGVSNNKGKEGVVIGKGAGIVCTPSLPYGVKQWTETTTKVYECEKEKQEKAPTVKTCAPNQKPAKNVVQYAEYFTNAQNELNTNIKQKIETLIESFPNYEEGQGYLSDAYLAFSNSLGAENVSESSNQLVNVGQQPTQMQSAIQQISQIVGDISDYFDGEFTAALDFRTLKG